ncbi:MAG: heterocyst development glycosyltransferase HepC [Microcoleaceae cyanobacterium]
MMFVFKPRLTTVDSLSLKFPTVIQDSNKPLSPPSGYQIQCRQRKLWVSPVTGRRKLTASTEVGTAWLKWWLHYPPLQAICLDSKLGEKALKQWADWSRSAGKPSFLRLPNMSRIPQKRKPKQWRCKRILDWVVAAILLTFLSPLMLVLTILISIDSPGPIFFKQWRVGYRGQLFQIIKFRSMKINAELLHHQVMGNQPGLHKHEADPRVTALGRWLRKYSLDELPQLINVLRGEMSLVGPRPWALYDALRMSNHTQKRLNALPGITGSWQVEDRSNLLDLEIVNQGDLQYLQNWSLQQDFTILWRTVPKVLSGSGAY